MESKNKFTEELITNAKAIVRPGFGILAADESTGTIGKRFDGIKVENTVENRRAYRSLLFETPDFEKHISGVILYEETLDQATADGTNFVELLQKKGVLPGIKVDMGVVPLPKSKGETATQGLDGLGARCKKYYEKGCRFAKWRAVLNIHVGNGLPSQQSINENAHTLARYAAICQDNGLVPIVEPEILQDGDHSIEVCADVTERVVMACSAALMEHRVLFEGMLLKPNMVTPGADCKDRKSFAEIAMYTVRSLSRSLPAAVPGVVFLSGGQSEEEASLNLSAMNKLDGINKPWALSFSYGRALQASTLKAWQGKTENVKAAQEAFIERCKANGAATLGKYEGGSGDSGSLYVKNYSY